MNTLPKMTKAERIRHTCNVPACVNPFHLSPGEPIDNSFDMHSQGRGKGTYGSGEAHPKAKLTVEKVRQIRDLYLTGNFTLVEIGQKFGVEEGGVRKILTGRHWNGLGRVSAKDYARTKHLHMKGMNNGEDCSNAKLKAIQIPEILARSEAGETYASIGRALGVHPATIWSIVHGKTWSSVSGVKQP